MGETNVCTSIVVAAELKYGASRKGSLKLTNQLNAILGVLEILPLEEPVDSVYGQIRVALEKTGQPIGGNDFLIAAQALALGYILVSDNEREFRRVEGLSVLNWLR